VTVAARFKQRLLEQEQYIERCAHRTPIGQRCFICEPLRLELFRRRARVEPKHAHQRKLR